MIIRIITEGQYELKGNALDELDEMDNAVLDALGKGDETLFRKAFNDVLSHIRAAGTRVPDSVLRESDLIMPPPDTSLTEARDLFAEYPRDLT